MELSTDHKRALQALCGWHLGDTYWARMMIKVVESDDPLDEAKREMEGETVESVLMSHRIEHHLS